MLAKKREVVDSSGLVGGVFGLGDEKMMGSMDAYHLNVEGTRNNQATGHSGRYLPRTKAPLPVRGVKKVGVRKRKNKDPPSLGRQREKRGVAVCGTFVGFVWVHVKSGGRGGVLPLQVGGESRRDQPVRGTRRSKVGRDAGCHG